MASIKRIGKRYQVRWRDWRLDGTRRPRKQTVDTKREAEELQTAARTAEWSRQAVDLSTLELPSVRTPEPEPAPPSDTERLTEARDAYIRWCAIAGYVQGTLKNRLGAIERWRERAGATSLGDLNRDALRAYRKLVADRPGCGAQYAREETKRIFGFWCWCFDEGWPVETPPRDLRLPDAWVDKSDYAPTWAEMDAAIRASDGTWVCDLLTLLRYTGLRSMQAMHLRVGHLDIDNKRLTIPPGLPGSKTKSIRRRGRILPAHPMLCEAVAAWGDRDPGEWLIDRAAKPLRAGRVQPDNDVRSFHVRAVARYWRAARPAVDLRVLRAPTHSFRHGFITGLISKGVDPDMRRYLTCHAAADTHASVYMHFTQVEDQTRALLDLVPPIDWDGPD
jgi:integrase